MDGHAPFLLMLIRSARQHPGQRARPSRALAHVPAPPACKRQAGRATPSCHALAVPRVPAKELEEAGTKTPEGTSASKCSPGPPISKPEGRDPVGKAGTDPTPWALAVTEGGL